LKLASSLALDHTCHCHNCLGCPQYLVFSGSPRSLCRSHLIFGNPRACSQYCTTAGLHAPQSIFSSVHRVACNGWLEKREEYRHVMRERCSLLAGAPGLNKCSSPPLDLRLDQPLSRRQRPTGALRLWVVARRHHDSLALRKRSRVLVTARCLLCGHSFWNHGFHATSIALPLARVALNNPFHQSYSLPSTRSWRRSY
jgi:hypothetical protein